MEINHKQLIFAREYRGYSQTELASNIEGLSQSNLSKYEKGLGLLSSEILVSIIDFLKFPESFFQNTISNKVENAHYRRKAGISKKLRSNIEYSNKLIGYIIDQMTDSIEWPEFNLKPLDLEDGYTPEYVAYYSRRILGLKDDEPVRNIYTLLERNGIIVVEYDPTEKFDAVSFLTDQGYRVIVINKSFSNDRKRFTLAHELGHIMMHLDSGVPIPEHRDKEDEANKFASEFLMPTEAIKPALRYLKLSDLSELKRYWLTSMAAILMKAKDLNCISQKTYTYLNIELSRKGYKKNEPINVFIDEPKLFLTSYQMHKTELQYTDEELAKAFNLPLDVINTFCPSQNRGKLKVLI